MAFPQENQKKLTVATSENGVRLDLFLARRLNVSRGQIHRLLASGAIRLDGRLEKRKGLILSTDQQIEVAEFQPENSQTVIARSDLPLAVLKSGEGWIAVDKPAGMPVHPLRRDESNTLLNAAIARYPQIQNIGEGGLRSGVVHRLDVDTSGVILLATDQQSWLRLRNAFQEHHTEKIYRAIVAGELSGKDHLVLDLHIAQHSPARVKVVDPKTLPKPPGTRRCNLTWKSIRSGEHASLLEIHLGTGFLHQIRVMLAHIGHPILGDMIYGPPIPNAQRLMLHAHSIRIGEIRAVSPEPADFSQSLLRLGLNK